MADDDEAENGEAKCYFQDQLLPLLTPLFFSKPFDSSFHDVSSFWFVFNYSFKPTNTIFDGLDEKLKTCEPTPVAAIALGMAFASYPIGYNEPPLAAL